jgi:hypothetical protein
VQIYVGTGATGLALPAGGQATSLEVQSLGADGTTGVRLAGAGATLQQSIIGLHEGGPTDTGVDVAAAGTVDDTTIYADVGIRSEGPALLTVLAGEFDTATGIRANHARIAGAALDASTGPSIEAVCPDPGAADADVSVTNVTAVGRNAPGSVGMRAVASDGGGQSCSANLDVNSSNITGVATALLAHGEGAGSAQAALRYSNFDPARIVTEGPATVNTASPGGNVNVSPNFVGPVPPPSRFFGTPKWGSGLIDRGDPAPLEPWQQGTLTVVHGRRDIGAAEYLFQAPFSFPNASPQRVGPGVQVRFGMNAHDLDVGDPLTATWHFEDGTTSTLHGVTYIDSDVTRTFRRIGTQTVTVTVADGAGLTGSGHADVVVLRPQILSLGFGRNRFHRGRRVFATCRLDVPAQVTFTIQRRVHRHGRSLWKRVPGKRTMLATRGYPDLFARFRLGSRWGKRHLRPGLFRLVATPTGSSRAHALFRILP